MESGTEVTAVQRTHVNAAVNLHADVYSLNYSVLARHGSGASC